MLKHRSHSDIEIGNVYHTHTMKSDLLGGNMKCNLLFVKNVKSDILLEDNTRSMTFHGLGIWR